ncbi:sensor histidine kinase [Romboutsia weinsteinii]|uniref:histidine kinase n=1 Tax=Romboutsia weinsteinii TaxID=2020949 RepID=A0A371J133_9FIRM|nr:HAMP domain-containing sensor histidine kinase [Romboutsia weinsteinii]RDY26394.1 sensor histidine kinase [Romboutsia weinsteinii]
MKKKLRNIGEDIKESRKEYVNIRTDTIDKDIEFVVSQINSIYDENQQIKIKSKTQEEELKRSISNISHDLRTPLTSIVGYLQLIKDESISNEEKLEYIEIIQRRTKNLEDLISNFYDLSRLEANDYKFSLEKVNLKSILSENIVLFYDEFIKQDIDPNIDMEDDIDDIFTDKSAIMRVFSNLINNMLKHGQGNVKISLRNDVNIIVSEFINYAPSLKEDDVDKIFERFYIGDKSRSSNSTGIGLSITKSLVNKLGHEIESSLINGNLIITIRWRKGI